MEKYLSDEKAMSVREMRDAGIPVRLIAKITGLAHSSIYTQLRRGDGAKTFDYAPPHLYDDEEEALTENQRRERDEAVMKAFRLKTEMEMTVDSARLALRVTEAEMMERMGIDVAQALMVRRCAWEFLERLEKGMGTTK